MKRIQQIQKQLDSKKLSAVLISKPVNVRYLCGYIGTNGRLLITPKKATLITDFRYLRSARKQIPKQVVIVEQKDGLKKLLGSFKTLGFEEQEVTQAQFEMYKKALPDVSLKPISGMVEGLRVIKDSEEVKLMKKACQIADELLKRVLKQVKPGVSEDDLEWQLLSIARDLGADGFSFPPILCFGKNTADVHHIKEPNKLKKGEPVLIDMGIEYKGYMTDMTRTFYTKPPTKVEQKIYTTVLEANQKAIATIQVGMKCADIDKVARDHIVKAGYGDRFGHSTGHGVGMEVHEAPFVGQGSNDTVQPGMIFTVEPGIYLDDLGGVRIEDQVYINEKGGVELLTRFPKELTIL